MPTSKVCSSWMAEEVDGAGKHLHLMHLWQAFPLGSVSSEQEEETVAEAEKSKASGRLRDSFSVWKVVLSHAQGKTDNLVVLRIRHRTLHMLGNHPIAYASQVNAS